MKQKALLFYIVLGSISLYFLRYQLNPDGISYIAVAERYAAGKFSEAINGYWGPLLSWASALLIAFKVPSLLAPKLVNFMAGAILCWNGLKIAEDLKIQKHVQIALAVILVCISAFCATVIVTPDVLLTAILTIYFRIIFKPKAFSKISTGVYCGLLGAIAYFAKSYALPFVVLHFSTLFALHCRKTNSVGQTQILSFLSGLLIFTTLSGVWIGLISTKYSHFTIGTAAKDNRKLFGPGIPSHAVHSETFLPPIPADGYSAWDDPYYSEKDRTGLDWSPFQSKAALRHQIFLIKRNAQTLFNSFYDYSPLWLVIMVGSLFFDLPLGVLGILLTFLIYPLGYLPINLEERYIWPIYPLFAALGAFALDRLLTKATLKPFQKAALFCVFVLSFITHPLFNIAERRGDGEYHFRTANYLRDQHKLTGYNVASNERWGDMAAINFHLKNHYYGTPARELTKEQVVAELRKRPIDYFFFNGGPGPEYDFYAKHFPEILGDAIVGLKIFKLK